MKQKEIFELIDRFQQSKLTKLVIKDGDFSLKLESMPVPPAPMIQAAVPMSAPTVAAGSPLAEQSESPPAAANSQESAASNNYVEVKAPIVGVFYAAPAPDAKAYVQIGEKVNKGQILCLVEAMKMMNELKSPVDGVIKTIKGINGELVEFDQVLFEVEPC